MTDLRLATSLGEVVREPDRVAIAATVEAAGRAGAGAFVTLDADGDSAFLQAVRLPGRRWQVEVWRDAGERYRVVVADDTTVVRTFWSWAQGTGDWQRLRWQPVRDRPVAAAG